MVIMGVGEHLPLQLLSCELLHWLCKMGPSAVGLVIKVHQPTPT